MGGIDYMRNAIEEILNEYAQIPYAYGDVEPTIVFDRENDRYLLLAIGWEGAKRVHGCIVHAEIRNNKIWIQQDGTEHGITDELIAKGVSEDSIVLGFHPEKVRQFTGLAVA